MPHSDSETAYADGYTLARLRNHTPEELLEGRVCLSLETHERSKVLFYDTIRENPLLFFELLQALDYDEQDVLLSYFLCGKSQTGLGHIFGLLQRNLGDYLLDAVSRLGLVAQHKNPYFKFRLNNLRVKNERLKDPPELGQFRVDVTSPGFASMFTARAARADFTADMSVERLMPEGVPRAPKPPPPPPPAKVDRRYGPWSEERKQKAAETRKRRKSPPCKNHAWTQARQLAHSKKMKAYWAARKAKNDNESAK